MSPRPRVFVSSVVDGFSSFREAARNGIEDGGAEPLLVNEDFPALPSSARTACLDGVASCDALVLVIGERGGWRTPSGHLVSEEEYQEAVRLNMPILVFIVEGPHDREAQAQIDSVSHYITGQFRIAVSTSDDLRSEVEKSIATLVSTLGLPCISPMDIQQHLQARRDHLDVPIVRLVVAPERQEELVDPLELGSDEFYDDLMGRMHEREVAFFHYDCGKTHSLDGNNLVVVQNDQHGAHARLRYARLTITPAGLLVLDKAVVTSEPRDHSDLGLSILMNDLRSTIATVIFAGSSFFDWHDRFNRHSRLLHNVALLDLGYRTIQDTRPSQGVPMRMSGSDDPICAYDAPRVVTRVTLRNPADEASRAAELIRRQSGGP